MSNEKFEIAKKANETLLSADIENFQQEIIFTSGDEATSFNAIYGATEKVKDNLDREIVVTNITVSTAKCHEDYNDEESPEIVKPCISFSTADGKTISTLSNGIWRSAKGLLSMGIIPTVDSPITIKFVLQSTKNGMSHSMQLIKY